MRASLATRLWEHVDFNGPGGCWLWTGASVIKGYGVIGRGRRGEGNILTHRAAWELLRGPIPEETPHLDHLCRVPLCCNPDHLEPVTQLENNRREWARLRTPCCPHGHEFTPENTYVHHGKGRTWRACRACHLARQRRAYQRKKGAA